MGISEMRGFGWNQDPPEELKYEYRPCMECVKNKDRNDTCEKCGKCGRWFETDGRCGDIDEYPSLR